MSGENNLNPYFWRLNFRIISREDEMIGRKVLIRNFRYGQ